VRARYPEYRDSGVEWLGDIPAHWHLHPLGRIGSFFKGGGGTKDDETNEGVPCVRYGDLYTEHQFSITRTRARISEEVTENYRQLVFGDVLFAGSGETIEEIGKSAVNLIKGRAYCGGDVIVFRPAVETNAAYLGYAADCQPAVYQKACMGRGVTVMHIYSRELKLLLIPVPPVGEQQAIAAFLDRETGKIDDLVAKKRLLLERLAEYRTALITRTVTQGLPPEAARAAGLEASPRLKPSGVEWLGDIPAHWHVRRLKDVGALIGGAGFPDALQGAEGEELLFFKVGDLSKATDGRWLVESEHTISREQATSLHAKVIPQGAIVYAKIGAALLLNRRRIIAQPSCIDNNMSAYIPDLGRVGTLWTLYSLMLIDFGLRVNPGAVPSLSEGDQACLPILVPPVGEQQAIAAFLDERTRRIDLLCERVETAIERLEEYRTALVTAAVTGKINVLDQPKPPVLHESLQPQGRHESVNKSP